MKVFSSLILAALVFSNLFAQELPIATNYKQAFEKGTRTMSGSPGKNYWQNTANYNLDVSFSPATRLVSGSEDIVYVNNSPDTLHQVWFKLYPNYYKKGAQRDSRIRKADLSDGVQIHSLKINEEVINTDSIDIAGTNMVVDVPEILPGKKIKFNLQFSYTLNRTSHQRTGMVDDSSAFIAYFFPRIAVYDDVDGWNKIPYTGTQEFYNDFCDFDVSISVPKNYIVAATGNLSNADEVFAPQIAQRILQAERSDAVTKIIDTPDLQKGNITAQNEMNRWKFQAKDVTDFVFATSDHYLWYASSLVVDPASKRRTRVDAVFNPEHEDYFDVIDYARKTVEVMSYTFPAWPFPYPHETVFDGLDQMEYPMMANDNPLRNKADEIELTDHEIFHTMFPFYMGVNETKYAWMDEGWATLGEWYISPMIDSTIRDDYGMESYNKHANYDFDSPITTLSTQETGTNYFLNSYPKPALGYLYVMDMLGDSLFNKALHYYIEQWHGKHPLPLDFFNCMNTGSGRNLNWFWKSWFYDGGMPDLAIDNVTQKGNNVSVTIEMKGTKPVPVHLTVYYKDGSSEKFHESIAVWEKNKSTTVNFHASKKINKIILGDLHDADANKRNNIYVM